MIFPSLVPNMICWELPFPICPISHCHCHCACSISRCLTIKIWKFLHYRMGSQCFGSLLWYLWRSQILWWRYSDDICIVSNLHCLMMYFFQQLVFCWFFVMAQAPYPFWWFRPFCASISPFVASLKASLYSLLSSFLWPFAFFTKLALFVWRLVVITTVYLRAHFLFDALFWFWCEYFSFSDLWMRVDLICWIFDDGGGVVDDFLSIIFTSMLFGMGGE